MTKEYYRVRYTVRNGKFTGLAGQGESGEMLETFEGTIRSFTEAVDKKAEHNNKTYQATLEIVVEEN